MSEWNWRLRLRSSLLAAIAGWFVGVLATLPVEASVAWRNTEGQTALMAETFGLGIIIWGTWTLVFSLLGWLIVAAPAALVLPLAWLQTHKIRVLIVTSLLTIVPPGYYFGLYTIFWKVSLFDAHNFWIYSLFGVAFVVVFLLTYLRLVWPRRD